MTKHLDMAASTQKKEEKSFSTASSCQQVAVSTRPKRHSETRHDLLDKRHSGLKARGGLPFQKWVRVRQSPAVPHRYEDRWRQSRGKPSASRKASNAVRRSAGTYLN